MKVASCLVLAFCLATAVAERQAPYLPSGWKPTGPAFLLPSEVQKPVDNPLVNHIEVEASGSDSLREYGPPAVSQVSQDFTNQALPEVSTEQSFALEAINVRTNDEATVKVNTDAVENKAQVEQAAVEERQDSDSEASQQQQDVTVNEVAQVKEEEQQVQNVDAALKTLEQEISSKQVSQEVSEERTIQQEAGVPADTPAGFLEYGPPAGHAEYGPPKDYETPALRSALINLGEADTTTVAPTTEETAGQVHSETRRRRFSPRLRPVRNIN